VKRSRGLQASDARSVLLLLSHYVPSHLASAVTRAPPYPRTPLHSIYAASPPLFKRAYSPQPYTYYHPTNSKHHFDSYSIFRPTGYTQTLIRTPAHIRAHIITSLITTYALQPQSTLSPFLEQQPITPLSTLSSLYLSTLSPFLEQQPITPLSTLSSLYLSTPMTHHRVTHVTTSLRTYRPFLSTLSPFLEQQPITPLSTPMTHHRVTHVTTSLRTYHPHPCAHIALS
jgi:hypothetical protein